MNNTLITLFGIRRSGIHLVANFLASQFDEPVHILNNQSIEQFIAAEQSGVDGKLEPVNARVVIFEEHPITALEAAEDHDFFPSLLGQYKNVHQVVLLRDPYNLFASRLKHYPECLSVEETWIKSSYITQQWLSYAERFQNPDGIIPLSYNKLISSKDDRKRIFKAIGGDKYTDEALSKIDPNGGGSSFTGQNETITPAQTGNRYRHYWDIKCFRDMFTPDYVTKAKEIFGMNLPIKEG
jgi:hypothetical protein